MANKEQERGRVAAIDLGKARVGIAISDELWMLAHRRQPLPGRDQNALLEALKQLAEEEHIVRFLVGLPLSLSGREGVAARRVARFCQKLVNATGKPVELVDERLTTVQAHAALSRGGIRKKDHQSRVDGVAAAILLQQWLDAQGDGAAEP